MGTDKSLVDQILAGNLGAFKQLVQQHERLVTHMVSRVIGDEEDIKDASQEVLSEYIKTLKLLISTGMPAGTVKNYIFRARKMLRERLQHYLKK